MIVILVGCGCCVCVCIEIEIKKLAELIRQPDEGHPARHGAQY